MLLTPANLIYSQESDLKRVGTHGNRSSEKMHGKPAQATSLTMLYWDRYSASFLREGQDSTKIQAFWNCLSPKKGSWEPLSSESPLGSAVDAWGILLWNKSGLNRADHNPLISVPHSWIWHTFGDGGSTVLSLLAAGVYWQGKSQCFQADALYFEGLETFCRELRRWDFPESWTGRIELTSTALIVLLGIPHASDC